MADAVNSPTYEERGEDKGREEEEDYKEFSSEMDLDDDEKAKLIDKLDKMFSYAADNPSWIRGRNAMIKCFQYREGEQWTEEEKKELEERHQPDTVNNQISVVVNRLVGDLVNQKFRVGFVGRNQEPDEGLGNVLSDLLMHVRQSNDLEFEERDMAEDGFTGGMGVLDVSVTFDDMDQPEIKVRNEDPLIVFPDPDSRRYDWNEDARFVARAKWWSIDEAAETYPQAEKDLRSASGGGTQGDGSSSAQIANVDHFKGERYIDKDNERIRLIEVQYKKIEREQVILLSNGTSSLVPEGELPKIIKEVKAQGLTYRMLNRLKTTICVGVYAAGILLEHKETDHKFFSLVPYFAYRRKTGEPYSLITLALSMQDAINKRESKALHLLNTNQAIYEKSAVDDPAKMAEEKAKPDGNIELRDGALANGRFQFKENVELAASQFNMHQRAQADLYAIVGMDQRMGQQTGELRSGTGLQKKYAEAAKPVATLFDNIRRTRKIFARVVLDLVQKYYTGEKIVMVTDDENASRMVGVNADQMTKLKTGIYDVVVTEFEDDPSTQDEHFRILMETLPQLLQFPAPYSLELLKASRVRNKEGLIKVLSEPQGPPPVQPKLTMQANLDALEPVERAGVWELAGKPEIAQAIMQIQPNTAQTAKSNTEVIKEHMKQNSASDQQRVQLEMGQAQADAEIKAQEHQMKMEAMTVKHQLEMQKMQMQLAVAQAKPQKDVK
jgi:hypothetical protein